MNNALKAALAALCLSASAGAAHADLDINGAVGLPLNPTANIPDLNSARIQGNYFDLGSNNGIKAKDYSLVGAYNVGSGVELNGGYDKLDTNPTTPARRDGLDLGVKYLFTKGDITVAPRFAVGGGYSRALARDTYFYGVVSKALGKLTEGIVPLTGHLGVRYDSFKSLSHRTSIYAGVEAPITRSGQFQVVGEVGTKVRSGGDAPYSASLRYRPLNAPLGISIGVARQGLTTSNGIFLQVGYTFGGKQF